MARRFKLREIEQERGIPLAHIIPSLVNTKGQKGAADELGVSQATISDWLKENGYVARTWWEKDATPQEKADIAAAVARVEAHRAELEAAS